MNLEKELKDLEEFMDGLTQLDRMNFEALVSLPNGLEVLAKMEDSNYRNKALLAFAISKALRDQEPEEDGIRALKEDTIVDGIPMKAGYKLLLKGQRTEEQK